MIEAVDGRELPPEVPEYDRVERRKRYAYDLIPNEIACALSHRKALRAFLDSEADYAVVLEDDALLAEHFSEGIRELTQRLHGWEVAKLYTDDGGKLYSLGDEGGAGAALQAVFPKKVVWVAVGWLYTRRAAQQVWEALAHFHLPADCQIGHTLLLQGIPTIGVSPSLITTADPYNEQSTIDPTGDRRSGLGARRSLLQYWRYRWRVVRVGRAKKRMMRLMRSRLSSFPMVAAEQCCRVPLAFASDDKGCLMLGIALYSLLLSQRPDTRYAIYILDDGISAENREMLRSLVQMRPCDIRFLPVGELLRAHEMRASSPWPRVAYSRMHLPELLAGEDRVLYLDVDILVMQDLQELYHAELGDNLAGVVYEQVTDDQRRRNGRLGLPPDALYFNSGVMLMNLARMRAEGLQEKLLAALSEHEGALSFPDQDALNICLQHRVLALHPRWNWPARHTQRTMLAQGSTWGEMGKEAALEAALHPGIIHFWGTPKPTQYNSIFQRKLYRRVWLQSPWRHVPYSGKGSLKQMLKRLKNWPKDIIARLRMRARLRREAR